ncbi:phage distal tail protein, Rcc01695 family [Thioclava sp. FR2]|uniref:phage distal tail protein, Rcc01695 family n=1 Tax=Thioclava sp. FR2 TaxID=3445780 RepID=UPI003EC13533
MAFHEIRFPEGLSFGSIGGPERRTEVIRLSNGFEERNTPWAHSRRRYEAGVGLRTLDDVETLIAFFEARNGRMHSFRWKDWSDYRSAPHSKPVSPTDQMIGTGDGVRTEFRLTKTYRSGEQSYVRQIDKPVAGTVVAAVARDPKVEGSEFTVDASTGVLTFAVPPDIGVLVHAGYEFDVPVRFDTDQIMISLSSFQAGEVPMVPVVEVRV